MNVRLRRQLKGSTQAKLVEPAPLSARLSRASTYSSADTELRVVPAARAAFAAHSYGGASMRTIAADVGVTATALYNYAPSKAALLQLVLDETMAEVYGSLRQARYTTVR